MSVERITSALVIINFSLRFSQLTTFKLVSGGRCWKSTGKMKSSRKGCFSLVFMAFDQIDRRVII